MMELPSQYVDYLDLLILAGQEPAATWLMQAFSVTREEAERILRIWHEAQGEAAE